MFFSCGRLLGSGSHPTDLDQGTTLLVTATLNFVETARLDGKLSVRAMNALQGPCLAFKNDAFVVASAELHFANCHNIVQTRNDDDDDDDFDLWGPDLMQISALDAEAAEVDGGAMSVRGSLMVMGTLIIRDCRTKDGKGGCLGSNMVAGLQELMKDGPKRLICGFATLSFRMPLVLQNRLLGGQVGPRVFVAFGCSDFCLLVSGAIAAKQHFVHSSGSISIINSSAGKDGGGLLLSSFGVGTTWLWPAEDQQGSQKRSFERPCVDVSGRGLLAVLMVV